MTDNAKDNRANPSPRKTRRNIKRNWQRIKEEA